MRAVLQRVTHASVKVDGETIGEIGNGFLILLGVAEEDNEAAADKMADKICKLRIFQDRDGKKMCIRDSSWGITSRSSRQVFSWERIRRVTEAV